MCLAAYCPAGADIPVEHLVEAFRNNPHGAGYSYFDDKGKVRRHRFMKFEEFMNSYERTKQQFGDSSPFSVHFRYATHGLTDIGNVHPFMYNGNTTVIHNGILPTIIDDIEMSDTASFVENYLTALPNEWYDNEYLFDMVQEYCSGSKLVILTANPKAQHSAYIVNEKDGLWDDGVWYSNRSYCRINPFAKSNARPVLQAEQKSLEDEAYEYDTIRIGRCDMCGEDAVLEDVCYHCASCQVCFMEEDYCMCYDSIHTMTDEQVGKL